MIIIHDSSKNIHICVIGTRGLDHDELIKGPDGLSSNYPDGVSVVCDPSGLKMEP